MKLFKIALLLLMFSSCEAQQLESPETRIDHRKILIGGPYENSHLFFEGMPSNLNAVDTSRTWTVGKEKLVIKGRILKRDGKTPVPDVILYYYQTNDDGIYPGGGANGNIRGWLKTDEEGRYTIYTSRPGPYPNRKDAAHIHPAVLEPGMEHPYYLDALVFDDDKLLTTEHRRSMNNRGGSGVMRLAKEGNVSVAEHDFILGLNIPGHPDENFDGDISGPAIGEDLFSFKPQHVWGADKGTTACPICKYRKYEGILYFSTGTESRQELEKWLVFFDELSEKRKGDLKVFYIGQEMPLELEQLGQRLRLQFVALTTADEENLSKNHISSDVDNTIIMYRKSRVVDKYIDLKPTNDNFEKLENSMLR